MLELPHAVVGATIAVLIPNPAISIPLALASHFAMDLFPHWNPHITQEIKRYGHFSPTTTFLLIIDSGSALVMGFFLAKLLLPNYWQSMNILICCFVAVLPDVIEIPITLFHQNWRWLKRYSKFETTYQSRLSAPLGIYTQLVVVAISFLLIFRNI